jgi:aminoglycoside phosphotransferase (APT) family kinase protein
MSEMTASGPIRQPPAGTLRWSANVLGCAPVVLRGLRDGGSPWLLKAGDRQVVLRTGHPVRSQQIATEAAALARAAATEVPVPDLLGHDDGRLAGGVPVVLSSCLPGDSRIPREPIRARLRALGAATARLHAWPCAPSLSLPRRHHPIGDLDFAAMRAGHDMGPLQREAQAILDAAAQLLAAEATVFVHGDLWQGNTLWVGDSLTGLVDWDAAGAGAPGVDLGSLRMDVALCYGTDTAGTDTAGTDTAGTDAAGEVTAGWEEAAGRPADNVAYWDIVAGLATPPDLGWFPEAIATQGGRPDLTRELIARRHADFLGQALDQLRS